MLGYWLGWLPIFDTLRTAIARLCCAPTRPQFQLDNNFKVKAASSFQPRDTAPAAAAATTGASGAAAGEATVPASKATAVSQLASQYAQRASPLSGLEATMLGAFGLVADDDTPLASDLELQNPFAALALTRLAGPAFDPVVPSPITEVFAQLLRTDRPSGGTTRSEAVHRRGADHHGRRSRDPPRGVARSTTEEGDQPGPHDHQPP